MTDPVLFERRGRIGLITLNRPRVLNAVNEAMAASLADTLSAVDRDPQIWAAVLTGAGRAFCSGGDLGELLDRWRQHPHDPRPGHLAKVLAGPMSTPLVAAANGLAHGGGTELVLAADLVVAAQEATFALPEVTRGILASAGGLVRLPGRIPVRHALWMALTGDPIDATTAERWGLVNTVVPGDRVLPVALDLAERICANAPLAVRASKRVVYREADGLRRDEEAAWRINAAERHAVMTSVDAGEGLRSFVEKRPPVWQGR